MYQSTVGRISVNQVQRHRSIVFLSTYSRWILGELSLKCQQGSSEAALQAATILVAMASEKNFGNQNSGESRQLATNRSEEKLLEKLSIMGRI